MDWLILFSKFYINFLRDNHILSCQVQFVILVFAPACPPSPPQKGKKYEKNGEILLLLKEYIYKDGGCSHVVGLWKAISSDWVIFLLLYV